ncbi:MAG: MarR family winged helix-turn-helix transcriptional regulator [Alphaproteobacteria bacterium]|nr:MarR family winged helix-turn-helix transcriptional regulator [Alphaproteobacteria bacterium]
MRTDYGQGDVQGADRRDARLVEATTFRLSVLLNYLTRLFPHTIGRDYDLSINEWRVVVTLAAWPGLSGAQLSDITGIDKMTVSRSARRLEETGRIERRQDPANRRRDQWSLTKEGWSQYDQLARMELDREEELLGAESPLMQPDVVSHTDALIDRMRRAAG